MRPTQAQTVQRLTQPRGHDNSPFLDPIGSVNNASPGPGHPDQRNQRYIGRLDTETEAEYNQRLDREWRDGLDEIRRNAPPPANNPPINPPPQPPPRRVYPGPATNRGGPGKKNTKASVKIAALNISGNGGPTVHSADNKWFEIWQVMREQKIGALLVSEAHLNEERSTDIMNLFGRRNYTVIRLDYSKHPHTANAKGVALVLNKYMVETADIRKWEIVPGRAMLTKMKNVDGSGLLVLVVGIYAPNAPGENATFWTTIKTFFETHTSLKPDIMAGDFNMVEDAIDRFPTRADNNSPVNAFDDLKNFLGLVDGWRETFPTTRAYTYHQTQAQGGSESRIDRMYVKESLFEHTFEWDIQTVGIKTDHRMISTRLTTEDAPTIGRGRWVWPAHLNADKVLREHIHDKGIELERKMDELEALGNIGRDDTHNFQTMWVEFKNDLCETGRERAKIQIPQITQEITALEDKIGTINADANLTEEERRLSGAVLIEKLAELERKRFKAARLTAQVRNRLEGETISRYWSMINKPSKPRELIHRLKKEIHPNGTVEYEKNSKEMASLARDYHDNLQSVRPEVPPEVREEKIRTVIGRTARKITEEQKEILQRRLTYEDVQRALKMSANNKAPGLDGIPYEVWRILDDRYRTDVH
ncbi:Endonuclease/exonuclease/phosphatase [Favolaschia claudopus]|uniref:Endonuclease/exonuclease/phosphatase n=1 Tax=Favolaschia claudopus TaxID=2862362 RepID=A0AAV9Z816_9AGAR